MSEVPVYFGVVRRNGIETPRKFFEEVPRELRKGDSLIYCTRIADAQVSAPLDDLMMYYRALKKAGKLPPEDRGRRPPPPKGETRTQHGEHWKPPKTWWDQDAVAYPSAVLRERTEDTERAGSAESTV